METSALPLPVFCREWGSSGPFPFPGNDLDEDFDDLFICLSVRKSASL